MLCHSVIKSRKNTTDIRQNYRNLQTGSGERRGILTSGCYTRLNPLTENNTPPYSPLNLPTFPQLAIITTNFLSYHYCMEGLITPALRRGPGRHASRLRSIPASDMYISGDLFPASPRHRPKKTLDMVGSAFGDAGLILGQYRDARSHLARAVRIGDGAGLVTTAWP